MFGKIKKENYDLQEREQILLSKMTLTKNDNGVSAIDMSAHFMVPDEDLPDHINVSYAAAKSTSNDAANDKDATSVTTKDKED